MSNAIINKNITLVRDMINQKKCLDKPFFATSQNITGVVTDYDHFPYTRWYRGRYLSEVPIVAEREAGYRTRHDACYGINKCCSSDLEDKPNVCFQDACSTIFPCNPCDPNDNPIKDRLYPYKKCFNLYR